MTYERLEWSYPLRKPGGIPFQELKKLLEENGVEGVRYAHNGSRHLYHVAYPAKYAQLVSEIMSKHRLFEVPYDRLEEQP